MLAVAAVLSISIVAASADTVPRSVIERELASLVQLDSIDGPDGLARIVSFDQDHVRPTSPLASFMARYGRHVDYLAKKTPGAGPRTLSAGDEPAQVRDSIIRALLSTDTFTRPVLHLLAAHWRGTRRVVADDAAVGPRHTVSEAQLRRIGARFFFPDGLTSDGRLLTHVCAGVNGVSALPGKVEPIVEAFAFVAVSSAFASPNGKSPLMRAYERAAQRAKAAAASRDSAAYVLRAQGVMWAEMENSPAMAAAISDAYRRFGSAMPFRLTGAGP
jgi:hypothetical protein